MAKVDELLTDILNRMDEKLDTLSINMAEQKQAFKQHLEQDSEMFAELKPVIEDFKFEKELNKRKTAQMAKVAKVVGLSAALLGMVPLVYSLSKAF